LRQAWGDAKPASAARLHTADVSAPQPQSAQRPLAIQVEQNAPAWFDWMSQGPPSQRLR